ncbi:DUF2987 domain-containing protein [Massilia sp. S19_KUP03_FR1]|uniref:DUF2987 domain-containing protein n=1 Tax=Massilia sp. S19_KUP03_FR1 TaxID=3025503 RepID=UPI002FCDE133
MKLSICLTAFAMNLASAAPVDRPWTHYNKLLELVRMDKFYAAPLAQRDKVVMLGVVHPDDPAMAEKDVVFTIVNGADRVRIQVSANGEFEVPFNPAWVKSDPEVLTTVPAGQKAKFTFNAVPVMPQRTQFDYASLMGGVAQVNALIKAQAGMLRFLMPDLVGVKLQFRKESHATVVLGATRIAADANGLVKLRLDKSLLAANVPVTLSEIPASTDFLQD